MDDGTLVFPRGDGVTHYFYLPTDVWSAGSVLYFAAKPVVDDDLTDANAVINYNWNDSTGGITDVVRAIEGVPTACKRYTCHFPPSATININSNGAESLDYLGEFQWIASGAEPITMPPIDPKIPVTVVFDIKRGITP